MEVGRNERERMGEADLRVMERERRGGKKRLGNYERKKGVWKRKGGWVERGARVVINGRRKGKRKGIKASKGGKK